MRFNLVDVRVRAEPPSEVGSSMAKKFLVPLAGTSDLWIVSAREHGDASFARNTGHPSRLSGLSKVV
jgi:hypothetical protein